MKYEVYKDIFERPDFGIFDFISVGKYGAIPKRIAFIPTGLSGVYNLAFGNINEDDSIDDTSVSDNGDRNKILATIAKVIAQYTFKFPERFIYFQGSTKGRTRLYRMAVSLNLEELSETFEVYGQEDIGGEFVLFHKEMKVNAFLIKRKYT